MRRAILFDLDGTLVDSARDIAVALSRLSQSRGGPAISAVAVRPLVSLGAETLVARALGPAAQDIHEDLDAFRALLKDVPHDPAIVFPQVAEALTTLSEEGYMLAVVTNKPQSLAALLLQAHDLARFFRVVVGGDTATRPKPDPGPLHHALAAMNGSTTNALFVGDSAVDASAAHAAGLPMILFEGGYGASEIGDAPIVARFDAYEKLPILIKTLCAT